MPITFDEKTMPMPLIIAFMTCEGMKLGWPMEWINKLWRVELKSGLGCYVTPEQIRWMV
jgi:hypothetical protein